MRNLVAAVERLDPLTVSGRVAAVNGLLIEVRGGLTRLAVGARVEVTRLGEAPLAAEVVGFRETRALLMPFGPVEGVAPGAEIRIEPAGSAVRPTRAWLGRVVDAFGQPIDGKGPLPQGLAAYPLRSPPPPAHARGRVGGRLDLGVRAMNAFTTCCRGQRLGVFAGSGVGKSVLLSMLAKNADCDAVVVGLIGERGREVREFIEETLGEEGLKRAVVVVATSDEPALKRRQAAYMTMSVAEFFRDQDMEVLCMMDSVTRFAMAQREIGLAAGEPPTTKGYTPTVFTELPKLLERAGPGPVRPDGTTAGPITAIFTVLVDGDDHNEPIADAVRGILDGHIVMERAIAERGRFPAINILKSISRTMP
ncbi:FliI/YscN family ATPase, partial [Phenylobacterium sp.]|uniref:FliI/YscN family ATPase n=1 Tax=Phenylobacterium sp. TaxID=1871053 RepID=UPI002F3E999E